MLNISCPTRFVNCQNAVVIVFLTNGPNAFIQNVLQKAKVNVKYDFLTQLHTIRDLYHKKHKKIKTNKTNKNNSIVDILLFIHN